MTKPVFRKIDCYSLPVDDLDKGIAFYASLGHALLWRDGRSGVRYRESNNFRYSVKTNTRFR